MVCDWQWRQEDFAPAEVVLQLSLVHGRAFANWKGTCRCAVVQAFSLCPRKWGQACPGLLSWPQCLAPAPSPVESASLDSSMRRKGCDSEILGFLGSSGWKTVRDNGIQVCVLHAGLNFFLPFQSSQGQRSLPLWERALKLAAVTSMVEYHSGQGY